MVLRAANKNIHACRGQAYLDYTTRSGRFIRHWRRSHRSPRQLANWFAMTRLYVLYERFRVFVFVVRTFGVGIRRIQ